MHRFWIIAAVLAVAWWANRSPEVEALVLADGSYEYPGYTFSNAEDYVLEARVLSREDYYLGRDAELSPVDLALGWGPMADPDVYGEIQVRQSGRWYRWRADEYPIPMPEISAHSANVHIVPASEQVAAELEDVEQHDLLRLTGKLVDIRAADGWHWLSSRSRTDTGNGSCELMLLERIDRI